MGRFGPHAKQVEALLEGLTAVRLLEPDAELDAETLEARQWLAARASEHHGALLPFVSTGAALPDLAVTVCRSMGLAGERWERAWERYWRLPAEPVPVAVRALSVAQGVVASALSEALFTALEPSVQEALAGALAPDGVWLRALGRAGVGPEGPRVVALWHARWLAAFGDDPAKPSPWAPLWALWERGAWPLMLPERDLLVYVPVLRGRDLVPEPAAATPGPVRERRRCARFPVEHLPSLEALGYGPAPGLDPAPLPEPTWRPTAEMLRTAGAPVVVTPIPPEPFEGPAEAASEPWYKRVWPKRGGAR